MNKRTNLPVIDAIIILMWPFSSQIDRTFAFAASSQHEDTLNAVAMNVIFLCHNSRCISHFEMSEMKSNIKLHNLKAIRGC